MKKEDFLESIKSSTNIDWLNDIELNVRYNHTGYEIKLKGIENISLFIYNQVDFWENYQNNSAYNQFGIFNSSFNFYNGIKKNFENLLLYIEDLSQLERHWKNIKSQLENNINHDIYADGDKTTVFLMNLFEINHSLFSGSLNFYKGGTSNHRNKEEIVGFNLASDFYTKINFKTAANGKIIKTNIDKLEKQFQEATLNSNKITLSYSEKIKDKYQDFTEDIESFKIEKENEVNNWFSESKTTYDEFIKNSNDERDNLKTTYDNLLKLNAPAHYWKESAEKLKKENTLFITILVLIICLSVIILFYILFWIPGLLSISFIDDTEKSIKWSIVFITLVSFLAYSIKVIGKLVFSTLHLTRDAEERYQLTNVYLSLSKEGVINDEERHLVLQSLFSRSDSGLLKDDSSPTMPNDILGKIFNK